MAAGQNKLRILKREQRRGTPPSRSGQIILLVLSFMGATLHAQTCKSNPLPPHSDWPVYGGQAEGDHYSSLTQINRTNVHLLKEAWKFDAAEEGGLETNQIGRAHV